MATIRSLSVDLETYSSVNLSKSGLYKYAESPDFEILLFGYSVDGSDVQVVDLACGEKLPDEIQAALTDASVACFISVPFLSLTNRQEARHDTLFHVQS